MKAHAVEILNAVNIPFYYYSIPFFNRREFPMLGFLEMATRRIPNRTAIAMRFSKNCMGQPYSTI